MNGTPEISPLPRGVVLGVDVGAVRTGIARCDPDRILAVPVETAPGGLEAIAPLLAHVSEYDAVAVVVGLPRTLRGSEGPAAAIVRAFAAHLRQELRADIPIWLVDERLSTVSATQQLRAAGRNTKSARQVIDQAAAVEILSAALELLRNARAPGELVSPTQ